LRQQALFLDRDGVINTDHGYVWKTDNFEFIDGIFDLCRAATQADYLLIVVTNQAGIGRGYYTEQDFDALSTWMCNRFELEGAPITDVIFCPDHPDHGIGSYKKDSFNRKPNPGMLLTMAMKHQISMQDSIMIGDKITDMEAAMRAGIGIRCLYQPEIHKIEEIPDVATHQIHSLREGILLLENYVGNCADS
jgi:D-glycero-D-manno-heptose 1,7-bisphosphate phosphatase